MRECLFSEKERETASLRTRAFRLEWAYIIVKGMNELGQIEVISYVRRWFFSLFLGFMMARVPPYMPLG